MLITVQAKTKSKRPGVRRLDATTFEVAVNELPAEGKANQAIIKALAKFLHIPSLDIELISGFTSKTKRLSIPDNSLPPWNEQSEMNL